MRGIYGQVRVRPCVSVSACVCVSLCDPCVPICLLHCYLLRNLQQAFSALDLLSYIMPSVSSYFSVGFLLWLEAEFIVVRSGLTSLSTIFSHITTVSGCDRELNAFIVLPH